MGIRLSCQGLPPDNPKIFKGGGERIRSERLGYFRLGQARLVGLDWERVG
jgi:hypothetical protein